MKVLFLTRTSIDNFGGVEKHVREIRNNLVKRGIKVSVISKKEIEYPEKKYLGLLLIWRWLFKNRRLILKSDILHIHDVFVWYIPFKFMFPNKKFYLTLHGWEGNWPIPFKNIFFKKVGMWMCAGSIAVGTYIEKYYSVTATKISYGGFSKVKTHGVRKIKNNILFVGRLDDDTGVVEFLKYLRKHKFSKVDFIGDGPLRSECEKYGTVHGFTDPTPFLKKAEYVVPGGYLAYIEAKQYGCKIITFANNELKREYWKGIKKIKEFPTWDELADEYLDLWGVKK